MPVRRNSPEVDTDLSALLRAWGEGDVDAGRRVVEAVYRELRRRAAAYLRRERGPQTLQPTALVHEVYLRLAQDDPIRWRNRDQFFGIAARLMRRILVDRARSRKMVKRSGQWSRVTLDDAVALHPARNLDVLDLDRALTDLATFDPRKSQITELRFFGGLSLEETAAVLNLSVATIEREWRAARAWLQSRLESHDA
jgi:RNA polymerase sigma factor (TIGR02999 family)